MSGNQPGAKGGQIPVNNMEICPANAASSHAQKNLSPGNRRPRDIADVQLAGFFQNSSFHWEDDRTVSARELIAKVQIATFYERGDFPVCHTAL